jgi:hypothetical protein
VIGASHEKLCGAQDPPLSMISYSMKILFTMVTPTFDTQKWNPDNYTTNFKRQNFHVEATKC